jgi:UDP-N-acetylglucosamine 2-epimerase (non-hydrolysing)
MPPSGSDDTTRSDFTLPRVVAVMGTRPEAIKLAPVVAELQRDAALEPRLVVTAQHRDLLDQVLGPFGLRPDVDLDLMQRGQSLALLTSRAVAALDQTLREERPDIVVVQGDTTTAMTAALSAFYLGIPVAHVEAGLRSGDIRNPFPEEVNRRIITQVADLHFAPTERNREILIREGVPPDSIVVTGNPGIDSLLSMAKSGAGEEDLAQAAPRLPDAALREVLVTLHRRESVGGPLEEICRAIARLAREIPDIRFLIPMHPNPAVRETIRRELADVEAVDLVAPLDYAAFVAAMNRSTLILTDSGGVQEEAPSLSVPVLVLRDTTERPEVIEAGAARLVGRDPEVIHAAAFELLTNEASRRAMMGKTNPYGDGTASHRIREGLTLFLEAATGALPGGAR